MRELMLEYIDPSLGNLIKTSGFTFHEKDSSSSLVSKSLTRVPKQAN
jgi:hypothetical protein